MKDRLKWESVTHHDLKAGVGSEQIFDVLESVLTLYAGKQAFTMTWTHLHFIETPLTRAEKLEG